MATVFVTRYVNSRCPNIHNGLEKRREFAYRAKNTVVTVKTTVATDKNSVATVKNVGSTGITGRGTDNRLLTGG